MSGHVGTAASDRASQTRPREGQGRGGGRYAKCGRRCADMHAPRPSVSETAGVSGGTPTGPPRRRIKRADAAPCYAPTSSARPSPSPRASKLAKVTGQRCYCFGLTKSTWLKGRRIVFFLLHPARPGKTCLFNPPSSGWRTPRHMIHSPATPHSRTESVDNTSRSCSMPPLSKSLVLD